MIHRLGQTVDTILNRYTMYRVVLYGLLGLLICAEVLALLGIITISASGLLISTAALIISCSVANRILSWAFHAATNTESCLISALILACILPPVTTLHQLGFICIAGSIAMATKYIIVLRGSHILNPVVAAAAFMGITGLLPATWWIATPALIPVSVVLALIVLRKQRKFTVFICFSLVALGMLIFVGSGLNGQTAAVVLKNALLSWPIIFFGSIMLDEPATLPAKLYEQLLYAILVGVIFASQLQVGPFATTPEAALLIGNLFTAFFVPSMGVMLRLKRITQIGPDIYDAAFERPKRPIIFTAGQYMEWTLPHPHTDSRGNRRIFSIASSPTEQDIHIGFRHYIQSSSFKSALLAMQPGSSIRATHVAGEFVLPDNISQPLLFIAGGIGITPFRSMIQYLIDTKQRADVIVIYFARDQADFAYKDVLQQARAVGVATHYIVGRPSHDILQSIAPDLTKRLIYLSGPNAFIASCRALLRAMHVCKRSIKTDYFNGY